MIDIRIMFFVDNFDEIFLKCQTKQNLTESESLEEFCSEKISEIPIDENRQIVKKGSLSH